VDDKVRIAELQAAVDRLTEENAQLVDRLMESKPPPVEWRLSVSEARILSCLARRPTATKPQLMMALYAGRIDDEPDIKIVDVLVCKARKKLLPLGIRILTQWGHGYYLDDATRARVRKDMGLA